MNLEDQADREQAMTVPCTWCGAVAGVECQNRVTGLPVEFIPAHVDRMKAAGVVHAPLDSRELRRG